VGVFTERDLLNKIVGRETDLNAPVSKWMSPVVATLTPEATIGDAVAIMNDKGYRNIPLVKDGKLMGSISVFDVHQLPGGKLPEDYDELATKSRSGHG